MVLTLSPDTMDALAAPKRAEWAHGAAEFLHNRYTAYFDALGVAAPMLVPLCNSVERWAAGYDVTLERDVLQLCAVAVSLGHQFWKDPRFQGHAAATLGDTSVSRKRCASQMSDHTATWLGTLWAGDSLPHFAQRLAAALKQDAPPTPEVLHRILPGHWALLSADQNAQLIPHLLTQTPAFSLRAQQTAYLALALVHGTGWWTDPQYPALTLAVQQANNPAQLAEALTAIYARLG